MERRFPALEEGLTFLASYPKSGNTWTRLLFRAYYHAQPLQFAQFDDVSPYAFQNASPIPWNQLDSGHEVQIRPAAMLHLARMAGTNRALVKTHHASQEADGMPMFADLFTDRVIHIVRDPRDVAPSFADHMGVDLETAVKRMNDSTTVLGGDEKAHHFVGSWSDHTGSWLRQDRVNSKTFKFEDLKADTQGTFADMLRFVGEDEVDEERLEVACDRTRLENLAAIEEEVGFAESTEHQENGFFRTGETGKELPQEALEQIEADHEETMKQVGYECRTR